MKLLAPLFLLSLCLTLTGRSQESNSLRFTKTVPLPGVKGRFDHFAIDANGHRLFVAALGNNTVEVIDTSVGKHLKSIAGQRKPTGVAYIPQPRRLFIANGDDGTLKVFDGETYQVVKTINGLDDADNVRYDAKEDRLYVGYGDGAVAIVDPKKLELIGSIKLKAHPESFQLENNGSRIFVNVPDAKQIAIIDREKRAVIATWPMERFRANFPMALDESNHRLFVGCRQPARVVVFDTQNGKPITDFAISGDTDDLFYDAKLQRLYISCGEGFMDVVEKLGAKSEPSVAKFPTRAGARTSFFSPDLNEFYLAVPQRGTDAAEIRIFTPTK
jgi:YVTN family beta-propeller protein